MQLPRSRPVLSQCMSRRSMEWFSPPKGNVPDLTAKAIPRYPSDEWLRGVKTFLNLGSPSDCVSGLKAAYTYLEEVACALSDDHFREFMGAIHTLDETEKALSNGFINLGSQ